MTDAVSRGADEEYLGFMIFSCFSVPGGPGIAGLDVSICKRSKIAPGAFL